MTKDRKSIDKQNQQPDNAELKNKLTEKQSPADTDKGGLSAQERAGMSTAGGVERQNVGELGTDKETKTKEKRNPKE